MRENVCVYYSGLSVKQCLEGIPYSDFFEGNPLANIDLIPCFGRNNRPCGKRRFPTEKEVREYEETVEAGTKGLIMAVDIIRKKHPSQRKGVGGSIACPVCGKTLKYSVASNGHIWGKCMTDGCLRWMQ